MGAFAQNNEGKWAKKNRHQSMSFDIGSATVGSVCELRQKYLGCIGPDLEYE